MERAIIALLDGVPGNPVTHSFDPNGADGKGIHQFENRIGGIPLGNERITISVVPPANRSNGLYVVTMKLWSPTLEQTSASTSTGIQPAPTVAYIASAELVLKLPARSTLDVRRNLRVLTKSWLESASAQAAVDRLEDFW